MSREYPDKPIVGVGAVIIDEKNRVLLIKRGKEPGYGRWSIPGGAVKLGEEVKEALKREVREETGLKIEVGPLIDVLNRIIKDEEGRIRFHYILLDYLCRVKSEGLLKVASDALDAKWVDKNSLAEYSLPRATSEIISKACKLLESSERLGQ